MPDRPARVAVVGAGLSGLRAVEQLLRTGLDCDIVVLGDEPHRPYSRPPLSKTAGAVTAEPTWFRLPDDDRVTWRTSTEVVAADLTARRLVLAGGEEVAYDGLVVATGVRARRLDVAGPRPFTLRTLDDQRALAEAVGRSRTALVVGAGVLGCELASTLSEAGLSVSVLVGPEELPMHSVLGTRLATELRARHEQRGTVFLTGPAVLGYSGAGAWLSDGRHVPADLVVETVGAVPNTAWLAGNDLDLSDGVRCHADLAVVGADRVVACGDVARFPSGRYDGRLIRVEHWTLAGESGRHAARTLARRLGADVAPSTGFDPLPTFWTDQLGARLQGIGLPRLGVADVRLLEGELGAGPVLGYHDRSDLVGVVLVDRPELAAGYRRTLISHRAG